MAEKSRGEEQLEKKYPVRKICAWCKKDLGDAGFLSEREGAITHGICPECKEKRKKRI